MAFGDTRKQRKLDSSLALYDLAKQSGLQRQADKILGEKGEETKRIFSGGFISDIFDGLNALQYGVTGMIKGKGFYEGVRTRQSFSDKDALGEHGIPGMIGGIALDIAVDPLTYIPPLAIAKRLGIVGKVKKMMGVAKQTKVGQEVGKRLIYRFGEDPIYKLVDERRLKNIATGQRNIQEIIEPIINLPAKKGAKLLTRTKTGSFIRTPLSELAPKAIPRLARKIPKELEPYKYTHFSDKEISVFKIKATPIGEAPRSLGEGIYLIPPKVDISKGVRFGKVKNEVFVDPSAKLLDINKNITQKGVIQEGAMKAIGSKLKIDKPFGRNQIPAFTKKAGYDGIKGLDQAVIYNPNILKTKSQITQATKRVKGVEPLIAKAGVLTEDEIWHLSKSYSILDDLGKQAVDSGLLAKGTWERNLGEYIKNAYTKFDLPDVAGKGLWGAAKRRIRGTSFMARQDAFGVIYQPARFTSKITKKFATQEARDAFLQDLINPEFAKAGGKVLKKFQPLTLAKRKELGEITNPAYLLAKSMMDIHLDLENAKLFQSVVRHGLGSKVMREGYMALPTTAKLGKLSGMFVPKPLADSITEIIKSRGAWDKTTGKLVGGFKFGKVICNPATHGRNIISNTMLNWWKLGMGPWRVDRYAEAVREVSTKGKWYKEAIDAGMDTSTYAYQEINSLLLGTDAMNAFGKSKKLWRKTVEKLGNIYQGEEEMAKMAAFIHLRKQGKVAKTAWEMAESATFNYAQVTPFIRRVRESLFGFPFITFTYKATPIAVETALKHPQRISSLGKIKQAIESQSDIKKTNEERASEPSWVRDGFYIKLPMEDKHGRSSYFDLTYIIPFGDLVSGDFWEKKVGRETGIEEAAHMGLIRKSPFFNLVKELSSNQDFYGNKIWKDGDEQHKQLGDIMRHLTKMYSPPLLADQIPGGYIAQGKYQGQRRPTTLERTKQAGEGTQYRTLAQELARNVGLKVQPIDADIQETYMEWEKQKALKTLLKEAGIISGFELTYEK